MTDALLTPEDVADRLRCSTRTVRRLVAQGRLRPVMVGRLPRFTEEEFRAFVSAAYRRAA